MHKKIKMFICLFCIFIFCISPQTCYAKYVIENIHVVAKLNIDRCKPTIELTYIATSNINHLTSANKARLITGHIKVIEKNIVKNNLSPDNISITVGNNLVTPEFKSFSLISQNSTEQIYEFSFVITTGNGSLEIVIPEGIIEDISGLINEQKYLSTDIFIN